MIKNCGHDALGLAVWVKRSGRVPGLRGVDGKEERPGFVGLPAKFEEKILRLRGQRKMLTG